MPDIELKLIANNQQYIAGIKEAQMAEQSMNDSFKQGEKDKQSLISQTTKSLTDEERALQIISTGVTKTGGSLKSQIAQMRTALSQMEQQGLSSTKAFMKLSIRAGELADQAGDTAQQIKILSSDTKNLDAAMSVGTGLAGGFALAQGSMALFGGESENMQKQLVKLQGGLNLLNGMQQVANVLNKDSAARVVLNAKAQELYAAVVGKSTGAMKNFKLALAATGIGLLIIGLGILIANWDKFSKSIGNAITGQGAMNDKIDAQIKLVDELKASTEKMNNEREREANLLEAQGDNEEKVAALKIASANASVQAKKEEMKLTELQIQKQIELLKTQVANTNSWLGNVKNFAQAITGNGPKAAIDKMKELNKTLDTQREEYKNLSNQSQVLAAAEGKRVKDIKKKEVEKALEEQKQKMKEFIDLLKQLSDKETAARINLLTGKDRIDAEEKLQLQEVDALKAHLQKLGTLNKTQLGQIESLKTSIRTNAQRDRQKLDDDEFKDEKEKRSKLNDLQRKIEEDQLELIGASEVKKLKLKQKFLIEDLMQLQTKGDAESKLMAKNIQQQIDIIQNEIDKADKSSFNIWKLLGIDPESDAGKKAVDAFKESSSIILDEIKSIMDAEVSQAEQHTQLIEQRLDEAESALDKELELQKDGYANNVDAKRVEIAQLKQERQKALEDEKKIKNAQLLLDSATQASSMITATANIIESFSSIPIVGQILAVIAIAAMWGTFAASKIKAAQMASNTKLEKGAFGDDSGIVTGKRHSQGGERFLDHVEVEQGEAWGVFNRNAVNKYGSFIPQLVDSMNQLQFNPNFKGSNTTVRLDTKKMQSELESINTGIRILNENMTNQSDVYYAGRARVVKLSKNHIRIIHDKN